MEWNGKVPRVSQENLFDGWGDPDEFEFSSGLKDDYDGEIVSSIFGYDARYNTGRTLCLILEVKDDADGEIIRTLYPCGSGWDNAEGGAKAVRADGKQTGFNKQTAIVDLLTSIASCGNDARDALVPRGFKPTYCPPLVGTRWHWTLKEKEYRVKDKETKEEKKGTSTRPMPVSFLGAKEGTGSVKSVRRAKGNTWDRLDEDSLQVFKEVAGEVNTHDEFIAKVSEEFEEAPEDIVMDPKFWDFLTGV